MNDVKTLHLGPVITAAAGFIIFVVLLMSFGWINVKSTEVAVEID